MTTLGLQTIAVPNEDMRDALAGQAGELDLVVWNGDMEITDDIRTRVGGVVLPYMHGGTTLKHLGELPHLKYVQGQSTGYDGVIEAAGAGVTVCNASGVHAASTAELAIGLILASLRGIDDAARDMLTESWSPARRPSLVDRRVLLIGVGGIGEEIALRLDPFGVELTRVGTSARTDARGRVHGTDELPELLPDAEIVIVMTPLTDATRGLVDSKFLARMRDGALLVNLARGQVVDTDALLAELSIGRLFAALDVVDPEPLPVGHALWKAPGVLITPHVGGNTSAFEPRIEALIGDQLRRINAGEPVSHQVN